MKLTRSEERIVVFVAQGASNKKIAAAIGSSESTVKAHVKAILKKLGAENRTQAALAWLRERGAATPPSASIADDVRAAGWAVAIHNDYRVGEVRHTRWLFTKDGRVVKGAGMSDAVALNEVRRQLGITVP